MDAIETHREAYKWAVELLEMTMADVKPEQASWRPPGVANPLGAVYAHTICELDVVINTVLKGGSPLFANEWKGRTGVSEPRPDMTLEWATRVEVDLRAARKYAQAVYESGDAFIASRSPRELEHEMDLGDGGRGRRTISWILSALVTSHINNMTGEISVLKGLQGAKGYPF